MTLVDQYVFCEKKSHEMIPDVVFEKNTHFNDTGGSKFMKLDSSHIEFAMT